MEKALNLGPSLMTPLMLQRLPFAIPTANTYNESINALKLVNATKCHIVTNVFQRLEIIEHAWQAVSNLLWLAQEINSFVDLVRSNINKDKNFINNHLLYFCQIIELLPDLDKKKGK